MIKYILLLSFCCFAQFGTPCDEFTTQDAILFNQNNCTLDGGEFSYTCTNELSPTEGEFADLVYKCDLGCNSTSAILEMSTLDSKNFQFNEDCNALSPTEPILVGSYCTEIADPLGDTYEIFISCAPWSVITGTNPTTQYTPNGGTGDPRIISELNDLRWENDYWSRDLANHNFITRQAQEKNRQQNELTNELLAKLDKTTDRANQNNFEQNNQTQQEIEWTREAIWVVQDLLQEQNDILRSSPGSSSGSSSTSSELIPDANGLDCDSYLPHIRNTLVECETTIQVQALPVEQDYFGLSSSVSISSMSTQIKLDIENSAIGQSINQNFSLSLTSQCPDIELNFCSILGTDCAVSFCDTRFYIFGMHPIELLGEILILITLINSWFIIFKAFRG